MFSELFKKIIKKSLNSVGLEIHRKGALSSCATQLRSSVNGLLQQIKNVGLSPATVLDVGTERHRPAYL